MFKLVGKVLAGILLIPFIILALASMVLLTVERSALNPDFYQQAFQKEGVYDALPTIIASQISHTMSRDPCIIDPESCEGGERAEASQGPPSYFQALTEEDWELLVSGLLPPDWLKGQVERITEDLLALQQPGTGQPSLSISLLELKERLSGEAGVKAIVDLLEDKPACTNDDILAMTRVLEGRQNPGEEFLSCRPSDEFIEVHTPQIEVILRRSLSDVPDEIDLTQGMFKKDRFGEPEAGGWKVFGHPLPPYLALMWTRWAIWMTPLAAVFLLLLVALVGVYSFKGLGKWWGVPLVLSGGIALLPTLLMGPFVTLVKNATLTGLNVSGISPLVVDTAKGLAVQFFRLFLSRLRLISLMVSGVGVGLIFVSAFIAKPQPEKAQDGKDVEGAGKDEGEIEMSEEAEA